MTPEEMAAAYEAGQRLDQIMAQAHLGKDKVRALLVEQGVTIRPPGWSRKPAMTPAEMAGAYVAGAGLRKVARAAGMTEVKVRALLVDQGVQIRPAPTGSGRRPSRPVPAGMRVHVERPGPLGPEELARLRAAVGVEVAR